jgi:DNA-binding GntR family transcriptional regulator
MNERIRGLPADFGMYVSKSDLVAAALRELIITGDLGPGTQLRQRELADRFRVSPTPVREALRRLQSEGLISYDAHKGSTVAQVDAGGQREKVQIRAALEGLASSLAAPKITDENIADLKDFNDRLIDPARSTAEINDINSRFHFHIYEIARSPLLLSLMRLLWQSFPGGPHVFRSREDSHMDHSALIDALEQHDAEAAQRLTQQHILGALEHIDAAAPPQAAFARRDRVPVANPPAV